MTSSYRIPVDSRSGLAAGLAVTLAGDSRVTASDAVEAAQVVGAEISRGLLQFDVIRIQTISV